MLKSMQNQLHSILNHPGLTYKKINKYKYLLNYKNNSWNLWPASGRFQHVYSNGEVSDLYLGNLQDFYRRFLAESLDLPKNSGKVWTNLDEHILCDMLDHGCTVNEIATELERSPGSVVNKLSIFLDDANLLKLITEDMYDVPVSILVSLS